MAQIFVSKGGKLQQIRCRLLSPFVSPAHLRQPGLYDRKGLVSRRRLPKMRARQTRDIRIERMFRNVPINICQRIRWLLCARIRCSIVGRRAARQGRQPLSPWLLHR